MYVHGNIELKGFITANDVGGGVCFVFSNDPKKELYMALEDGYCSLNDGRLFAAEFAEDKPIEIIKCHIVIEY